VVLESRIREKVSRRTICPRFSIRSSLRKPRAKESVLDSPWSTASSTRMVATSRSTARWRRTKFRVILTLEGGILLQVRPRRKQQLQGSECDIHLPCIRRPG